MRKIYLISWLAAVATLLATDSKGKWVLLEKIGVEYRLTMLARNACQVEVRQVKAVAQKKFVLHSRYYPHVARKTAVIERSDPVILGGSEAGIVHISDCEGFASVDIE